MSTDIPLEPISILNDKDMKELKEEIKKDKNIPIILRDTFNQLFGENPG